MQSAIENNLYSNKTTLDELLYSILPVTHDVHSLTSSTQRQYVKTLSANYSTIILSPPSTSSSNIQVLAGITVANITNYTLCSNGIVYYVDQFIAAPLNVINTISTLSELNQLENIIKSQNLSNIFTATPNQTIFAPVDAAWSALNGTNVPFGTMIHDLKYHVANGTYYQQDLLNKNLTLATTFSSATVQTEAYADGRIVIIGGAYAADSMDGVADDTTLTVANIVRSDILTSSGTVIHLIDKILPADPTNVVSLVRGGDITSNTTKSRNVNALAAQTSSSATTRMFSHGLFLIVFTAIMTCYTISY
ncbi:FAS1 domain-containing protein [Mucor lusitanicus]|nr:FAS1 domain-containing protein [Mucor lusitanicus]